MSTRKTLENSQNPIKEDVIDLTKGIPGCKTFSTNLVIDLVNDVFYEESDYFTAKITVKRTNPGSSDAANHSDNESEEGPESKKSRNIGLCSICWEELDNQQLASTRCGHVFCMACLKLSLKNNKRCPTCRAALRGTTAYHPLYLPTL